MKQSTKKFLKVFPVVILLALCAVLVTVTAAERAKKYAIPVMAGEQTSAAVTTRQEGAKEQEDVKNAAEGTGPVDAETTEESGDVREPSSEGLVYRSLGDGTCLVCDMGTCRDSAVIIPTRSPSGEVVVGIEDLAFRGCRSLSYITLPDTLTRIGAYAFYGSGLCGITIPASVTVMGEYVFCNCENLTGINVEEGSGAFASVDGILFDKTLETLLCYPAGRNTNYCTIPETVREIRAMAFYHCDSIKLVHYAGDSRAFARIRIGAGNEVVESAVLTYATSEIYPQIREK